MVEKIANIPNREGLPKNEYDKALGISKVDKSRSTQKYGWNKNRRKN